MVTLTSPISVHRIDLSTAKDFCRQWHYSDIFPPHPAVCNENRQGYLLELPTTCLSVGQPLNRQRQTILEE